MEAAGIEPASRDISTMASTCVADYLFFANLAANRQAEKLTSQKLCLTANVFDVLCSDLELVTRFQGSPAKPIIRSYAFLLRSQSQVVVGK